ncbi:hypothetical protein CcaverHIS002_0210910 [Cutaneotrichosporon cavernicola]|uniref:N-terminal acetyltransferase A, auxiliary subunit n=1 Tax=Cutaneotrichosporon cavernicola TaxID=279322 RepID=A0AA48I4Y6_9TREE|nr:uncharacterized protein CcaverHIS019_0210910 [Cutaneotrichosporon cavernicola]BEI81931.1 hypothetical protein CcaverHIS002_0210910 [Cutaneotrichosporon cavernicola]BEI89729.1 hypothetical protein CcaverHIS019_0210910 [Cutaneotrichosporon cavernicola]BEI97500.1 hypothetical protein CcaverHIS631_0210890 [Cutaneotrichosporon cavernicola]BEJ05278.1 hypothetical protein CcaverHIS641_0210950 [Cutaneotrichosporon cavernicola]
MSHGQHNIPKHRALPEKESRLFKEVLQFYEAKQYKKGIKAADQILKKFPNHGETIAIKALTIHSSLPSPPTPSSVPKAEEAEAMARVAIKKDMTSHITWHVLGILAKTRKDWAEATKAFAMARRQDPDNIPVLRDAFALATHTRNYESAAESRHHFLCLRPQIRSSWLGLMVAHDLAGDFEEGIKVFESYEGILEKDGATAPERAQVLLFVIKMYIKARRQQGALDRLERGVKDGVLSRRGEVTLIQAQLLGELGRTDEAEDAYRQLLEQNPDNLEYYRLFLKSRGLDMSGELDDEATSKVLKALAQFAEQFPRSTAPKRLPLDVAKGEEFRALAREYLVRGLERGVPSLFVDVKGLYTDAAKMATVGELTEEIVRELQAEHSLHSDDTVPPPTALLWAYYFLALHLVHPLRPQAEHARALELLEVALKHTPTLPEIYMAKAMVLKRAGDPLGAAYAMEEARLLDGQDRFLNGKAAKYWLRAGNVVKAEELLALFTKQDTTAVQDLTDMQCLWFLQEEGSAHTRNGALGFALKRYQALVAVFQEYEDDQYDFHSYCMRRMTFSYYLSLLEYEDQLRVHPAFLRTALAAIDIYVRIADDPSLTVEKLTPEEEAERKKAAKKAAKAGAKARKAALNSGEKKEEGPVPDADPRGDALLKTESPLADALKLWKPLSVHHARNPATWVTGYALHARSGEFVKALRDLRCAAALDPNAAGLLPALVDFRHRLRDAKLAPEVQGAIDATLPSLIEGEVGDLAAKRAQQGPQGVLDAAKALLRAGDKDGARDTLLRLAEAPDIALMREALTVLPSEKAALAAAYHKAAPLAFVFASPEEEKVHEEELKQLYALPVIEGKTDV